MTEWKLQQIPLASFNYRHEAFGGTQTFGELQSS